MKKDDIIFLGFLSGMLEKTAEGLGLSTPEAQDYMTNEPASSDQRHEQVDPQGSQIERGGGAPSMGMNQPGGDDLGLADLSPDEMNYLFTLMNRYQQPQGPQYRNQRQPY